MTDKIKTFQPKNSKWKWSNKEHVKKYFNAKNGVCDDSNQSKLNNKKSQWQRKSVLVATNDNKRKTNVSFEKKPLKNY